MKNSRRIFVTSLDSCNPLHESFIKRIIHNSTGGIMQDFYYKRVEDGTYCVTGYEGDEQDVVIPEDRVITMVYDKVFRGHSEIRSIHIPDTGL